MIAIYARKSVFREDSISIESQIEMCQYEAKGEECIVYTDNGFSGKNTDRPEYQRMIEDIKNKRIEKVIVYKLDRISRSILDFSRMMDLFQKMNVSFVSATEHFDTSSPMGRAMLNICIVFAQLERETIQQRVADAYASRSKKGFYMGGKIPYGYTKVPITINGVKTSMYEPQPEEAEVVKFIFELYSKPSITLGDVLRELEKNGLNTNGRNRSWQTARISETMRNPVYTYANRDTYNFFKSQGCNIINPIDDFTGETGLYLFTGENDNRKTWDLSNHNIVVAPHQPIIDSATWLICRKKLLANHQMKTCKAKNSFLAGKIKCGHCGYGFVIKNSKRQTSEDVRYFVDTGRTMMRSCQVKPSALRADEFEASIVEHIKAKLSTLTIKKREKTNLVDNKVEKLNLQRDKISTEIDNILNTLATASNPVAMNYIEKKIAELDSQKKKIESEIQSIQYEHGAKSKNQSFILDAVSKWDSLSFDDKKAVVDLIIGKIVVFKDHIEIEWRV